MAWEPVTPAPGHVWGEVVGETSASWVPALDWVLFSGAWDDVGIWNDTKMWIDSPPQWVEVAR